MANGYDRFDNEGNGGSGFVMGLLTGTVLGAGLGMLFAPKAGSELRGQLSEQANNLANQASDGYRKASDAASDWADRGKEAYGKAREAVNKGAEDAYGRAREAVTKGADEAKSYIRDTADTMSNTPSSPTGPGGSRLS